MPSRSSSACAIALTAVLTLVLTVLSGAAYHETDSTEGRHVWPLQEATVALAPRRLERRELLLWDMAGQQGYRVVHLDWP